MSESTSPVLPTQVAELPDGHLYVTALAGVTENFTVHVRGFQAVAEVARLGNGASSAWTVTVVDKLDSEGPVASGVVSGTQVRAALQACGMLLGYAATQGVEGVMPGARSLRVQLMD